MRGEIIRLSSVWTIGDHLDGGGFGQVYEATSEIGDAVVAKFVPQAPGADRELLFVDLSDVRNIVPILDRGEFKGHWVLVMPRADTSLRKHLEASGGSLDIAETLGVLGDVTDALVDLDGEVVHRDIKPANVLRLDGRWCLADFGISRYAEATTAPDTQKFAWSAAYAAPERWRAERATSAADVYAVGVMAFEMLSGALPFAASSREEMRDAHLHQDPPHLSEAPAGLAALVDECLYKGPGARPSPANLRARLSRLDNPATSPGLAALQEANRAQVRRISIESRNDEVARTEAEQRSQLADGAERSFARISDTLRNAITDAAPSIAVTSGKAGWLWSLQLNEAVLSLGAPRWLAAVSWGNWSSPSFDLISASRLSLRIPRDRYGYEGRSHSLWFGDVQVEGEFAWFESAFMHSPLLARHGVQDPFALDPGEEAAQALWGGLGDFQTAWPFTALVVGEMDKFVDRWSGWFAGVRGTPHSSEPDARAVSARELASVTRGAASLVPPSVTVLDALAVCSR